MKGIAACVAFASAVALVVFSFGAADAAETEFAQHLQQGYALVQSGDVQKAFAEFDKAMAMAKQPNERAQVHINRSLAYERLGDFRGMRDEAGRAIALQPGNTHGYNNRGWAQWKLGAVKEALSDFTEALKADPQNTRAYLNRAVVKERLGDQSGVLSDMASIAKIKPELADLSKVNENMLTLYHAGQYEQALPLALWAVDVAVKKMGPDHPETATTLFNLAEVYEDLRQYPKAGPLYQRALALREKALGPNHLAVAEVLHWLGLHEYEMRDYARAEVLLKRALAIREKALGPDHRDVVQTVSSLAFVAFLAQDFAQAEPLMNRALAAAEKIYGPQHPALQQYLNNLGALYAYRGEYEKAEPLLMRAVENIERSLGPDHSSLEDPLTNLASMYDYSGQHAKAIVLRQRVVRIQEKAWGAEHPRVVPGLTNLAIDYDTRGEYAQSGPLYERALAIQEKAVGPEHRDVAVALDHLADWHERMRQYDKARELYERALKIRQRLFGQDSPETARSLQNLASRLKGKEALPLLQKVLAIEEKTFGGESPQVAETLQQLGWRYQDMHEYAKAKPLYLRAMAIRDKIFAHDHPARGASLNALGQFYLVTGEYAKAEPLLQEDLALALKNHGPEHPVIAVIRCNLALLDAARHRHQNALDSLKNALFIEEREIRQVFPFATEEQQLQFVQSFQSNYSLFLSLVHQHFRTDRNGVREGLELVLRRKGLVLDAQSRMRETVASHLPEKAQKEWARLSSFRAELAGLLLHQPEKMNAENYRARVSALREKIEASERQLAGDSTLVAAELQQRVPTAEGVLNSLPAGSVLVEFARIQDYDFATTQWKPSWRYLAFVLKATGDIVLVDLGEAGPLEAHAQQALKDIRLSQTNPSRSSSGRMLRSVESLSVRLWTPLEKVIGPADKLLVIPEGQLNLIPFAALLDSRGHPLLEQFRIAYVTSGRELIGQPGLAAQPVSDLALVANPAYDQKVPNKGDSNGALRAVDFRGAFQPLPGTEQEAREIPPLVGGRSSQKQILTGVSATEGIVKSLRSPRILHLATHGFFLEDKKPGPVRSDPGTISVLISTDRSVAKGYERSLVRSGLALAGANYAAQITQGDDGLLTALEITGMDLRGTDLVVLSACETGVGEVQNGEGVFGLRRAFAVAGARNLMMSLWPVNDEITANQMRLFYKKLQTLPPAEALRQAQLDTIKALKAQHNGVAPPALWAPFILQGAQALGK